MCFDRTLKMGIQNLYMDTRDITNLRIEQQQKQDPNYKAKQALFSSSADKQREQQANRAKLEAAFEREKSKSVISKRCTRISDSSLKTVDPELFEHLIENEVLPELYQTRWLRCMLSREFSVQTSMELWDYMLAGIPAQALTEESLNTPCYDLQELAEDPFNQLEFICLAMIVAKREELLDSDFSGCLGIFMKYDEP